MYGTAGFKYHRRINSGPFGAISAAQAPRAEPAFMVGFGFRSIRGYMIPTAAPRAQLAFIGWSLCPTEWLELHSSSSYIILLKK